MAYAAPAKRLTLTEKASSNEDKESPVLTIIAGILFVVGCSCYFAGSLLSLPENADSGAWMFNAIGAGVFILCGLVEFCNYMGGFHIFLVFAGIFALAAEILDAQQQPISIQLNWLASHMYFCEAVKVYQAHAEDFYFMEIASKYIMVGTLKVADIFFLAGTLIDITLGYMYLFNTSADAAGQSHISLTRTPEQIYADLASASLWLACSILTLTVYVQMARAKAEMDEDDDEEEKTHLSTGI